MATINENHRPEIAENFTGRRFDGVIPEDQEIVPITSLGKGLTLEYEKKVDFTKKLATIILEMTEFKGERGLRNDHVSYLINCMKRDTFLGEMVRLVTCICQEKIGDNAADTEYRMNGQHCCWARLEMPDSYKCAKVALACYKAKSLQDMRTLYCSIDRGAPRTKSHVIFAHLVGIDMFEGMPETLVKFLGAGYPFYKWSLLQERKKYDGDAIAFMMQSEDANLVKVVCAYMSTFSISSLQWMQRSPVMGAMYATFNKAIDPSAEFWDGVRIGLGFTDPDDPRLKLRSALMTCAISNTPVTQTGSRKTKSVSSEEVYCWCIHAWNAWRQGRSLKALRYNVRDERPKAK